MRFLSAVILTAICSYLTSLILPWWIISVCGFLVALVIFQHPFKSFVAGFLGVFVLWISVAGYMDQANQHVLSVRIAALFGFHEPLVLILITGFTGGIVAAMGAITGALLQSDRATKRAA